MKPPPPDPAFPHLLKTGLQAAWKETVSDTQGPPHTTLLLFEDHGTHTPEAGCQLPHWVPPGSRWALGCPKDTVLV